MGLVSQGRDEGSIIPCVSIASSEKYRGWETLMEIAKYLWEVEGIKCHVDMYDKRGPRFTKGGIPYNRNYRTLRLSIRSHHHVRLTLEALLPYLHIRKNSAEDLLRLRFLQLFPPRTGPYASKLWQYRKRTNSRKFQKANGSYKSFVIIDLRANPLRRVQMSSPPLEFYYCQAD